MKRQFFMLFASAALIFVLSACNNGAANDGGSTDLPDDTTYQSQPVEDEADTAEDAGEPEERPEMPDLPFASTLPQLSPVQPGETIAVMTTNFGDITFRFFPQYAPYAVENFLTHAENGYYDGVIFHRVVPGFVIQGGDPTGTGMGGESIWGGNFPNEDMPGLHHLRGALSMANAGPDTNSSQFFVVSNAGMDEDTREFFMEMKEDLDEIVIDDGMGYTLTWGDFFTPEIIDHYLSEGGSPQLDNPFGRFTVFGQVIDGMDVVDAINNTPFIEEDRPGEGRPVEDVIILGIEVTTY